MPVGKKLLSAVPLLDNRYDIERTNIKIQKGSERMYLCRLYPNSVASAWVMERCDRKYVSRSKVYRDSIENAFLSYA